MMTYAKGQSVEIVGPDYAGDSDDLGKVGRIVRSRGGGDYWVQFVDGTGTTFDETSLRPHFKTDATGRLSDVPVLHDTTGD